MVIPYLALYWAGGRLCTPLALSISNHLFNKLFRIKAILVFLSIGGHSSRNSNGDKRCYIIHGANFGLRDAINDRLAHTEYHTRTKLPELK
jgi:hypothetical protein